MHKDTVRERFTRIAAHLDEQAKRLWCANEAIALGRGGVTYVSQATGVSRTTITTGIMELNGNKTLPESGIRRKGGGRKKNGSRYASERGFGNPGRTVYPRRSRIVFTVGQ